MKANIIIKENEKRKQKFNAPYNPIRGQGSHIPRFTTDVVPGASIDLPLEMKSDPIFQQLSQKGWEFVKNRYFTEEKYTEQEKEELLQAVFHKARCRYDYEYWCATSVKIHNNLGKKVPFILNLPQRISMADREAMRTEGRPVRQIEIKHRQYGSTTEKNAYVYWLQNIVHPGYRSYICSLDTTASTKIVGRYKVIADNYPHEDGVFDILPYMSLRNTYHIPQTGAVINIGTAERPNAPSGDTAQILLISEAGKMKSTVEKGADKLITNMISMLPMLPDTYAMIESTAEISGAWFRSEVFKAKREESGFSLTFISCLSDDSLQVDINDKGAFIESMSERDWLIWEKGATLEQIRWYNRKEREYQNTWQMQQEFPITIEEAFASSGKKVFSPAMIQIARSSVRKPDYIGEIHGNTTMGPTSLEGLQFHEDPKGSLKIWMHPNDYKTDKTVAHRGAVFVDIGGVHKDSDYSVIKVADRWPLIEGGSAECAAEWRGHIDPELLAWKSAQIARYFYEAVLAVEVNALYSRGNNTDGVHYLTIFNEIANHYPNLFTREAADKVKERPTRYGYHMTNASKDILVSGLKSAWRPLTGGGWIERSEVTVDEASYFEVKDDGTMGAIDGEHDDSLISAGGVKWLATDYMPAPFYIEETKKREVMYNEAMI